MTSSLDDESAAWLRLLLTEGVGRQSARRLLAAFGSARAVFEAGAAARRGLVAASQAEQLATPPADFDQACELLQSWLAASPQRQLLTLADAQYPRLLLQTADPPLLLFAQGRCELLNAQALAIVGSRNPSAQGADNAREFAAHLSRNGWAVVSGLATGIDGAAHEGALQGSAGTIAVVGTGLDRVYPARHRELAHRIAQHGVLISEFPLGTPPLPGNFPLRNRIIAGITRGTLVVEAALQSGSLITARLAAESGREVFAIPGSIHAPQSRGCHALLRQGAKLVETAQDILEEFGAHAPDPAAAATEANPGAGGPGGEPADADRALLAALGHDPVSLDALQARTGWPIGELSARLLQLELQGLLARLPGGLYQRRQSA